MREKIVDRVGEVSNNLTLLSLDLETLGDVMKDCSMEQKSSNVKNQKAYL